MTQTTFIDLLIGKLEPWGAKTAILAPNQQSLTYAQLLEQIEYTVTTLNRHEISRHDRVAVVLPNGPAMATAFVAIAAGATCAPLNPNYRRAEYEFYLSDLKAKALVVAEDTTSPAIDIANSLGIPIFRLRQTTVAGQFTLHSDQAPAHTRSPTFAPLSDIALVLHTSGTTSRPKIVPLSHRNIMATARNIRQTLQLTPADRCLNMMPLFHIHGLMAAVLSSFAAGASLVCTPGFLAPNFYEWLSQFKPTWYTAVPTMHQAILARAHHNQAIIEQSNLRFIRSSSASLSPQVLRELEKTFRAPVIEAYGMTEAAHQMTCNPLPPQPHKAGTVGPAAGPEVAIMDEIGNLLVESQVGEIVIRGQNVTAGYENNPGANAKAFTNGWFRTGDQGLMDKDGYITITGRLKEIINRGGEKISPREVDEVLLDHPDIVQSLAFAVPHPQLGEDIAAAVVLAEGATPTPLAIRQFVAQVLADFKVPRQIVILDEIPKGPTGKLQRIGLAERLGITADMPALNQIQDWTPPTTETEQLLADIWSEVLALHRPDDKPAVGIHAPFLALGGDSITATQIIARIEHHIGIHISFIELLEASTIAEQALLVDKLLLNNKLPSSEARIGDFEDQTIPRIPRKQTLPASISQTQLWFLDQMTDDPAVFNIPIALHLTGVLHIEAFQRSLHLLLARHESLRTTFALVAETVIQKVHPTLTIDMPLVDLRTLTKIEQDVAVKKFTQAVHCYAFDLDTGPLLQTKLLQLANDSFIWLFAMHHITGDAWSTERLLQELFAFYKAEIASTSPDLPSLPIQYADFAAWQQTQSQQGAFTTQQAYWVQQLKGAPALLELPTDKIRPPIKTYAGAAIVRTLPDDLLAQLQRLNHRTNTTLFMTLLATFYLLMARLSGQDDIVLGVPVTGRNRIELEPLIGFLMNSLALRIQIKPEDTFRHLLNRVRQHTGEAHAHQNVPFDNIVQVLSPERNLSHTPIFQVFFNMFMGPEADLDLPDMQIERLYNPELGAKFDLTLYVRPQAGQVSLRFLYNQDLFSQDRIVTMADQFEALLYQVVSHPEARLIDFSLQTVASKSKLPDPTAPLPDEWMGAIHERLTHHAQKQPMNTAVVDHQTHWTYADLEQHSNRLAHYLRYQQVQDEDIVAIYAHRSASLVWAIMAVLKAGAAYTILDPAYPPARLINYIDMAKPCFLLHIDAAGEMPAQLAERIEPIEQLRLPDLHTAVSQNFLYNYPLTPPTITVGAEDLAALSFTSGSTGLPKGVMSRHGPLTHFLPWQIEKMSLTKADKFSMMSGLSHDPLQRDIFTTLWVGAQLHIPEKNIIGTPGALAHWFAQRGITFAHLTPPMVQLLVDTATVKLPELRFVSFVGDKLTKQDVFRTRQLAPNATCLNSYGSTETQRSVSYYFIPPHEDCWQKSVYPLGQGIPDTQLLLLNQGGNLAGVGEVGEIYMRSPHLARGYWQNYDLTAERFITNPFTQNPEDILYRTGDLGRYLPDGQAVFVGRIDRQVKIRGYRIEPGEIEALLTQKANVRQAVVTPFVHPALGEALAAYVVAKDTTVSVPSLRDTLKSHLPSYMVPNPIILLKTFPLTPNGKLDLDALPDPVEVMTELKDDTADRSHTETETALAQIWANVLGLKTVKVTDNFFELGGHSLLAAKLFQQIDEKLGQQLPFSTLFQFSTVAEMARAMKDTKAEEEWNALVTMQAGNPDKTPLFFIHGLGGGVFDYGKLARLIGQDQPAFGILARGVDGLSEPQQTIEEMAQSYTGLIKKVQPNGPYQLVGYCYGGIVAFEVARQLEARGDAVNFVGILEGYAPLASDQRPKFWQNPQNITRFLLNIPYWFYEFQKLGTGKMSLRFRRKLRLAGKHMLRNLAITTHVEVNDLIDEADKLPQNTQNLMKAQLEALRHYKAGPINGRIVLFRTRARPLFRSQDPQMGWQKLTHGPVSVYTINGSNHLNILERPYVQSIAATMKIEIDEANTP